MDPYATDASSPPAAPSLSHGGGDPSGGRVAPSGEGLFDPCVAAAAAGVNGGVGNERVAQSSAMMLDTIRLVEMTAENPTPPLPLAVVGEGTDAK